MKKLKLSIIMILLFPAFAYAGGGGATAMMMGGSAGCSGCSEETNEVGNRSIETGTGNRSVDTIACVLYTADCSGNTVTGYLYSGANNGSAAAVAIYSDNDSSGTPTTGDALQSAMPLAGDPAAAGWASGAMGTQYGVTSGSSYFVCFSPKNSTWAAKVGTGVSAFTKACVGCADSMPADLAGVWTETANQKVSIFVTVGP